MSDNEVIGKSRRVYDVCVVAKPGYGVTAGPLMPAIGYRIELGIGVAGARRVLGLDDISLIESHCPNARAAHGLCPRCNHLGNRRHQPKAVIWDDRVQYPVKG